MASPERARRAAISTPWSVYLGFGVEGIETPEARNAVIGRAVGYPLC